MRNLLFLMLLNVFCILSSSPVKAAEECKLLVRSFDKHINSNFDEATKKFNAIISTTLGETIKEKIDRLNQRKIDGVAFAEDEKELNDLSAEIEAKYGANKITGISIVAYVSDGADTDAIKIRFKSRFSEEGLSDKEKEILSDRSAILYYNADVKRPFSEHIGQDDAGSNSLEEFLEYQESDCESSLPKIEPQPVLGNEVADQKRETSQKVSEDTEISAPTAPANAAK